MNNIKKFKRNLNLFYLNSLFIGLAFLYDLVLIVYYQSFGLSAAKAGLILAAMTLFSFIFEVPSGAFADIYGKKKSLLISNFLFVISFALTAIFPTFYMFLLASAILGISFAFNSGAQQALIYDSLEKIGRHREYLKIRSRTESIFLVTTILTGFFGPYLYTINKFIPIVLSAFFGIFSLVLTLLLYEEHRTKKKSNFIKEHISQMKNGTIFTFSNNKLIWLISFSIFGLLLQWLMGTFGGTPYLLGLGFVMTQIGIISLIATPIQTIFTARISHLEEKLGENKSLIFLVVGASVTLFLTLFIKSIFIGILFGLMWGFITFRELVLENYINLHLNKGNRATIHSIHSMFRSLSGTILLPVLGLIIDKTSTIAVIKYSSIFYLIGGLLLCYYKYLKKI